MFKCILLLSISLTSIAEEKLDISIEDKVKFWKAVAETKNAELVLERANTKLQSIIQELNTKCNSKLTTDTEGNPVCVTEKVKP